MHELCEDPEKVDIIHNSVFPSQPDKLPIIADTVNELLLNSLVVKSDENQNTDTPCSDKSLDDLKW